MVAIGLSTLFIHYVAMPLWNYYRLSPKTRLTLWKLNTPASLPTSGTMPFEDLLKTIKSVSQGPNDTGIPIYVDPVGLNETEKTMTSPVNVSPKHQPIGKTLEEVLDQLGMAYSVRDGLLMITSKESLDTPFEDSPIP
jgi:hypothetical protein